MIKLEFLLCSIEAPDVLAKFRLTRQIYSRISTNEKDLSGIERQELVTSMMYSKIKFGLDKLPAGELVFRIKPFNGVQITSHVHGIIISVAISKENEETASSIAARSKKSSLL